MIPTIPTQKIYLFLEFNKTGFMTAALQIIGNACKRGEMPAKVGKMPVNACKTGWGLGAACFCLAVQNSVARF